NDHPSLSSAPPVLLASSESPTDSTRCNFICDSWDCSDERHCGYHKESPVLGAPFSCDFEQDDCGWTDTSTSTYKWVRDQRGFSMRGSRSHGDHTLGNKWGWFLATEGHRGKSPVTATLRSPVLQDAASTCEIHVHYHMWAEGSPTVNGSLSVELADNKQTYSLWMSPQTSVLAWRKAVIYTGRIKGTFQLVVSSRRDPPSRGDMAIDDVEFRHCALSAPQVGCAAGQYQCARGSCVAQDALCDSNDDCGDNSDENSCEKFNSCDFGTDYCDWTSTWERVNASKSIRDHTSSSASGVYLRVGPSNKAKMTSQRLQGVSNESCSLVLYYLMDGSDANTLVVRYVGAKTMELSRLEGQRGRVWLRERVTVPVTNEPFQITIDGDLGAESGALIALDDLIFSPGCRSVAGRFIWSRTDLQAPRFGQDPRHGGVRAICQPVFENVDFEVDVKGWKDRSVGRLRWARENRTLQDGDSRVGLSVQSAGGQLLTSAELRSPAYCAAGPSCAINMTYYFNSGTKGSLSVSVLDLESLTHTHAWRSQGDTSATWRSVLIPLAERKQPIQVVLGGSVDPEPGGRWAAAVHSIQFIGCDPAVPSSATGPVTCNFESGSCGWFQDKTEEIDWEWGTLSDHTTGTGNFLYVSGTSRMERGMRARLVTYPQSPSSAQQCLSLHYRIWGPDVGTLNLFIKPAGESEALLWTVGGTHGNRWHRETVTLSTPTDKKYQLVLDAVRDGAVGHISVDDITLRPGPCDPPTRCSFEAGNCGFTSQGTSKWNLHQNQHFNGQTAPIHDHTLQSITGHYMLVDTSSTAMSKSKSAVLTSASYSARLDAGCLSFWYQLGGSKAGSLNVNLEENAGKKKVKRRLLSVSEEHRNVWHYKSVTLQSGTTWVLLFEAIGAGGDHSFIALDDIHMSHYPCHEPATCDFESGFCSWTNVRIPLVDTYDWDWTSGGARTVPEKDHTLGTSEGHFAFVDTGALHTEGSSAWLISEHLPATTGSCFSFSYHVDSADHFHLAELVLYITSAQGVLPVWVLQGFHDNGWQEVQLQLNSTVEYQIVFEAAKGSRPHSAIVGLDDLKYTQDTHCNSVRKDKGAGKNNAGTVLAIFFCVLILLACVVGAFLLYRKRKRNLEGAPRLSSRVEVLEGFDNVVFEENTDRTSTTSDISTS
ncbi:apical endosomal glycoprotein, partial [Discoglossus pictus]